MLNRIQMLANLATRGIKPAVVDLSDNMYACPARRWVEDGFAHSVGSILDQLEVNRYQLEKWDCDDFARLGATVAQLLHARTHDGKPGMGLAIGYFAYNDERRGGHAINIAVVEHGELVFFEPQTQALARLSEQEIQSCFRLNF